MTVRRNACAPDTIFLSAPRPHRILVLFLYEKGTEFHSLAPQADIALNFQTKKGMADNKHVCHALQKILPSEGVSRIQRFRSRPVFRKKLTS